ncbi:MAG TPA: SAM-dependent methyltransferase, partial [Chloroflexota bacterium]|nr:SAM-dependent methyltransferase [Chloroflexota bacterium]
MRLSVVGLGPGRADWISAAAIDRLHTPGASVFARTRFFPGLDSLLADVRWDSFDELYERGDTLHEVHAEMAERLLTAGADVVLAVPGDGTLGEAVLDPLRRGGATIDVIPGITLGVSALAAAALAASDGAQIVEATALGGSGIDLLIELNPRWPAVITGVFNPRVAGDVKLALQRVYPAEHEITLVRHPGLTDEQIAHVTLDQLDRTSLDLDHLTHTVVPAEIGHVPNGSMHSLRAIVARLRAPVIGCPWDLEQTHQSLIPYIIEEAYEVVDAIEDDEPASMADELGDVLLQV